MFERDAGPGKWMVRKAWIRGRCWGAFPTPNTMGKVKCEVLMWHQQRKNVGKGREKRQEAKRRLIFKNKM